MKKKIGVALLTLTLSLGIYTGTVHAAFTDVYENAWYYEAVQYVSQKGIMTGLDSTRFGITEPLKRAQFVLILYRLAGEPDVTFSYDFPDIGPGDWYASAVMWANENGIATGYTDTGLFGPSDEITREQMVAMLYRFEGEPQETADLSGYPDAGLVGQWSFGAVQWAVKNGIITGDGGMLNPQYTTSREQCAMIIMRYLEGKNTGDSGTARFLDPCPGAYYVSSEFGYRDAPTSGASTFHNGRDYAAAEGTPILAAASGVVKTVSYSNARGNYIVIDHGNGIESWYQHCLVIGAAEGDTVAAGQKIAEVGSTGIVSGAHLHLEIHVNEKPVDPRLYVPI